MTNALGFIFVVMRKPRKAERPLKHWKADRWDKLHAVSGDATANQGDKSPAHLKKPASTPVGREEESDEENEIPFLFKKVSSSKPWIQIYSRYNYLAVQFFYPMGDGGLVMREERVPYPANGQPLVIYDERDSVALDSASGNILDWFRVWPAVLNNKCILLNLPVEPLDFLNSWMHFRLKALKPLSLIQGTGSGPSLPKIIISRWSIEKFVFFFWIYVRDIREVCKKWFFFTNLSTRMNQKACEWKSYKNFQKNTRK